MASSGGNHTEEGVGGEFGGGASDRDWAGLLYAKDCGPVGGEDVPGLGGLGKPELWWESKWVLSGEESVATSMEEWSIFAYPELHGAV